MTDTVGTLAGADASPGELDILRAYIGEKQEEFLSEEGEVKDEFDFILFVSFLLFGSSWFFYRKVYSLAGWYYLSLICGVFVALPLVLIAGEERYSLVVLTVKLAIIAFWAFKAKKMYVDKAYEKALRVAAQVEPHNRLLMAKMRGNPSVAYGAIGILIEVVIKVVLL